MSEKYKAFISYRHVPADITAAKEVQKRLEHFHIPSSIRKTYGIKEIGKLFRDQDELPITSDISENITEALHNSEKLIVICSKDTSSSRWVAREISEFLKTHSLQDVLTVLVNGEPGEVIPHVLLEEEVRVTDAEGNEYTEMRPREPLSCDLRKSKKEARNAEIPRLAAALVGCSYDELVQRQKQYKTRRLTAWTSAISVLTTSGAGYMTWSRSQVQNSLREAQIRESMYLASEAKDLLDSHDNITAAQLIMEALPSAEDPRPLVPQAVSVLSKAVNAYTAPSTDYANNGKYTMNAVVSSFCVNEDGNLLAVRDESGQLALYDLETDRSLSFTCMDRVQSAFFLKEDHLLVSDGSKVQMYDVSDERVVWDYDVDSVFSMSKYVRAGNTRVVILDVSTITVLDSDTGELLLQKEREADSMYITVTDANSCISEDDRYFRTILLRYEDQTKSVFQFDTETGEMLEGATQCSDLSILTATKDGTAAAGTIASQEGQLEDTLRVEIFDRSMNLTGSYEEAIGPNHSVKDIRVIPYPVSENNVQDVLAVVYDNRELLLDPVTGTLIRQILFPETISVPFLSVTENGQLHLNSHGQQSGYAYEGNWVIFGTKEFPEDIRRACTAVGKDGMRSIFIQQNEGRAVQRYTQGVYDDGMEDLGTPDSADVKYIAAGDRMGDDYLYLSQTDSKLYVCRIHDGEHTVTTIPGRIGAISRIGIWNGNILYKVFPMDDEDLGVLSVTPEGTAELLKLSKNDQYVIVSDELYEIGSDGISRIDPDTLQKETILSEYAYFREKNPVSESILIRTLLSSAVVDLKSGKVTEYLEPIDENTAGFSDDGKTVFMVKEAAYKDMDTGETVQLPVKDSCSVFLHSNDLYLLAEDGTLTAVDIRDGHTKQKTQLSGSAAGDAKWQIFGDTLYIYSSQILHMVDLSSGTEYAAVKNCVSYDPVSGEIYVQYLDRSTSSRSRIGRFHRYTAAELLEKGYAYTRGEALEEPLRLRYGLK